MSNQDYTNNPLENVQSHDWNRERLEQLKKLIPDLFTNEGKLNINELKKVIDPNSINETERYEFRWFGKSNAKREAFTPTDATLIYDEARSVNPTESENLIIEGENLAVLKLLSQSYREQIKCIYIDPPYNTGNDFVYSDKFNQDRKEYWEDTGMTENGVKIDSNVETDGRFHSNWLNMMFSRLLIARQLLREDGVIFISIDDNEVHHLRKLCDEVFGEENFRGMIVRTTGTRMGSGNKEISSEVDYVIVYSKTDAFSFVPQAMNEEDLTIYDQEDEGGKYLLRSLRRTGGENRREDRPSMFYPIYAPDGTEVLPIAPAGWESRWICGKDTFESLVQDKMIEWKKVTKDGTDKWQVYQKHYIGDAVKYVSNNWDDIDGNKKATRELNDLFDGIKYFDHPKPVDFINRIIAISTKEDNEIFLDFFAGSGTTGQAITKFNRKNSFNHKYILVQLPEATDEKSEAYKAGFKKISDITIERNKRVIEKIIEEKKNEQPDLFDNKGDKKRQLNGLGFKVFKLTKSNFPRVEYAPDPEKSDEENVEALKKYIADKEAQLITAFNRDELITEILIKNGFKLNYTITQQDQFKKNELFLASDGEKETLLCLDGTLADETVEYFKSHTDQKLIVLERALDTTKKWNLKHYMGDKFKAF